MTQRERGIAMSRAITAEEALAARRIEPPLAGGDVDADRPGRPETVAVLVVGRMQQDRAGTGPLSVGRTGLLEAAGNYDAGVRLRMAMAGQRALGGVVRLAQREERRRRHLAAGTVDVRAACCRRHRCFVNAMHDSIVL